MPESSEFRRRLANFGAAAGLLANSDLPLSTIALDLGFYDQSHFTRVFRQLTGATPGMFREEYALHKKMGLQAALTAGNSREVRAVE